MRCFIITHSINMCVCVICPASNVLTTHLSFLCARFCFGQLSPVCAIVGGILGQEIIKVRQ